MWLCRRTFLVNRIVFEKPMKGESTKFGNCRYASRMART